MRYFTLDEAQLSLPEVERHLREALFHKSQSQEAQGQMDKTAQRVRDSGGARVNPSEVLAQRARRDTSLERMANEADQISGFLGGAIYDKLRAYCAKLVDHPIRGRTAAQLVDDAAARKALYAEVDDELKRTVPIVINDPVDAELRLKAYLTHKLK